MDALKRSLLNKSFVLYNIYMLASSDHFSPAALIERIEEWNSAKTVALAALLADWFRANKVQFYGTDDYVTMQGVGICFHLALMRTHRWDSDGGLIESVSELASALNRAVIDYPKN